MTMKSLFDYFDYRVYLQDYFASKGQRSGEKSAFCKSAQIQTSFLSQVLSGQVDLSLEHAYRANQHFKHDRWASEYFLNAVQMARAGSAELRDYFKSKLEDLRDEQNKIANRVDTNIEFTDQQRAQYFSSWHYAAIHMMGTLKPARTLVGIAEELKLPLAAVQEVVDFLRIHGFLKLTGDRLVIGPSRIHLGSDSTYIKNHHTNWRLKAIQDLDKKDASSLHYSVTYSIARKDAELIKSKIVNLIQENIKIVEPSSEEVLMCSLMDFFAVTG